VSLLTAGNEAKRADRADASAENAD